MVNCKKIVLPSVLMFFSITPLAIGAPSIKVNQQVWSEFSASEHISILAKFPDVEVAPIDSVGIVQSVQVLNRSVAASNGGAALGSVLGQATYIDRAAKGGGANYSAKSQVGAALLGAVVGSALDTPGYTKFLLNYGIKTADGQTHAVHVDSADEVAKPNGQCVYLADLNLAPPELCLFDKVQFIKYLSNFAKSDNVGLAVIPMHAKSVACRVPNVGLMTLTLDACTQLDGVIEK